jgi:purine-cytosine permease-like protein
MGNAALVVGLLGTVVAVVAVALKANFEEFLALIVAIAFALILIMLAEPTVLPSGTECPGILGTIKPGYSLPDAQWTSDFAECQKRMHDNAVKFRWVLPIGIALTTVGIVTGRRSRQKEEKQ